MIKFHFFNTEHMICQADVTFPDRGLWKYIAIVWATLEILGCSSMQTRRAMFSIFYVQKSIGRCECCSTWPMRYKINDQAELEILGLPDQLIAVYIERIA
jgi:hypothetical protein